MSVIVIFSEAWIDLEKLFGAASATRPSTSQADK